MVGFPKHLNTKQDYLYIKEHFPEEQWLPEFQRLLDDRMAWESVKQLADSGGKLGKAEEGITDDIHKVVTVETDGKIERFQYELREDSRCKLYRLGFTVAEVEEIVQPD